MPRVSTAEPQTFDMPSAANSSQPSTVRANYEAASPTRFRKFRQRTGSQNDLVARAGAPLRTQVRHLVRNHDLARGALRTMVNNIAGPQGIGVEPQPRTMGGEIARETAVALRELWRDWSIRPEVTHTLTLSRLQRAVARSWIRDGEVFAQLLPGTVAQLDHGTRVPFSLELFEADLVPLDYTDTNLRISQGIERNAWGRPVALHAYRRQPWLAAVPSTLDRVRISWDRVLQVATLDHIGQMRGVSDFASIITRLEDIKDYEESERVAAKIAAMLTAYIKKGDSASYEAAVDDEPREIPLEAGTIIDDLTAGEEIGLVDSKRPNPNLITFRQGQMRAAAAGIGASYSSLARDYTGTYSAQRQELVEQWVHYAVLSDEFVSMFLAPVYRQFVQVALASGLLPDSRNLDPNTVTDCLYVAQAMPWIDPLKEALGAEALIKAGLASEVEQIRRRGTNPHDLLEQMSSWRKECEDRGLYFSTNEAAMEAFKLAAAGGGE